MWSDLHLGHGNIIDYQDRPFLDVADQDAELWRAWEQIDPDAVLVVVGGRRNEAKRHGSG